MCNQQTPSAHLRGSSRRTCHLQWPPQTQSQKHRAPSGLTPAGTCLLITKNVSSPESREAGQAWHLRWTLSHMAGPLRGSAVSQPCPFGSQRALWSRDAHVCRRPLLGNPLGAGQHRPRLSKLLNQKHNEHPTSFTIFSWPMIPSPGCVARASAKHSSSIFFFLLV